MIVYSHDLYPFASKCMYLLLPLVNLKLLRVPKSH